MGAIYVAHVKRAEVAPAETRGCDPAMYARQSTTHDAALQEPREFALSPRGLITWHVRVRRGAARELVRARPAAMAPREAPSGGVHQL